MFEPVQIAEQPPRPDALDRWARLEGKSTAAAHDLRLRYARRPTYRVTFKRLTVGAAVRLLAWAAEIWWQSRGS